MIGRSCFCKIFRSSFNVYPSLRQFHQTKKFFNHYEMKLFTDKGNLSALKILAACSYNDQRVEVKTVSRKGKNHVFLFINHFPTIKFSLIYKSEFLNKKLGILLWLRAYDERKYELYTVGDILQLR